MKFGESTTYDVIILGTGGAGMMCAIHAARRGRRVALLDHSSKVGGKILISGGGRCNFTNLGASPLNYLSQIPISRNPLSLVTFQLLIAMVEAHEIVLAKKNSANSSAMDPRRRSSTCSSQNARSRRKKFILNCKIDKVRKVSGDSGKFNDETSLFEIKTSLGRFYSTISGCRNRRAFASEVGRNRPWLHDRQAVWPRASRACTGTGWIYFRPTGCAEFSSAGVSADVIMTANGKAFRENLLFTHAGLSGPASLQASLHWYAGDTVEVNLSPEIDVTRYLLQKKKEGARAEVKNLLAEIIPRRLAERFCELYYAGASTGTGPNATPSLPLAEIPDRQLTDLAEKIQSWRFIPSGTVGYSKAEVTRGGVDTNELSSKTLEAKKVPGLYFIGEVVDVTGWLGGYNFQWAWASGWAAGQVV